MILRARIWKNRKRWTVAFMNNTTVNPSWPAWISGTTCRHWHEAVAYAVKELRAIAYGELS